MQSPSSRPQQNAGRPRRRWYAPSRWHSPGPPAAPPAGPAPAPQRPPSPPRTAPGPPGPGPGTPGSSPGGCSSPPPEGSSCVRRSQNGSVLPPRRRRPSPPGSSSRRPVWSGYENLRASVSLLFTGWTHPRPQPVFCSILTENCGGGNPRRSPHPLWPRHAWSEAIFSCLTLWSMTCRPASSSRTSPREMPAWTISTITW